MATGRINKCTLEFEDVKLPEKTLRWQKDEDYFAKKLLIILQATLAVVNLTAALIATSEAAVSQAEQVIYTAVSDFGSLILLITCYVVLPSRGIFFAGMNHLSLIGMLVLEFEFNSMMYKDYGNIAN
ncbi:MAG: hypothetical protein P4M11_08485 [Candidatus Pacebacteria bacterium]|nr:hypothetical protein [Candidatus Paceibacterota bacterium]